LAREINLTVTETVVLFIEAVVTGQMLTILPRKVREAMAEPVAPIGSHVDELLLLGPRGEGKTWGVLCAAIRHAQLHEAAGFPLPVPWLWFRDSFTNHERNLLQDLQREELQGFWSLHEGGRLVKGNMSGKEIIRAFVFGLEDKDAVERLRAGCVGVFGEEPAPAVGLGLGTGWGETSWSLALSSQRVPSHYHPALLASNYPEKRHWSWQRFVEKRQAQCGFFRIPPGERATPAYRARLARTTSTQPTMLQRLFLGEPAPSRLGDPAVMGYSERTHRRYTPVPVAPGSLVFGFDFWHHPAVAIASITSMGQLRFHFAQRLDQADIGILVDEAVKPWLAQNGLMDRPRIHTGDPTGDTGDQSDRAMSAVKRLRQRLPGEWRPATNDFSKLSGAVNDNLRRNLTTGDPAILLGPEAGELSDAWSGGWHVNEHGKPVQHGEEGFHAHVGMAGAYVCFFVFGAGPQIDVSKWANQPAYRQPWGGSRNPTPPPAASAPARFDPEAWRRQYLK
jgi:hypothetical protein